MTFSSKEDMMRQQPMTDDMDLNSLVWSILRAVQEAKRLGDMESAKLAETYKKEKALSTFNVPAFAISDVEVELRFAVIGHVPEKPIAGGGGLRVNVAAEYLKGLDPSLIQVMKIKVAPVSYRIFEEGEEQ